MIILDDSKASGLWDHSVKTFADANSSIHMTTCRLLIDGADNIS